MPRAAMTDSAVAEMRERISDAALGLLREGGTDNVSFRRIAAKLGVSYTALYRYFESKDDIIAALRADAYRRFGDKLHASVDTLDAPSTSRLRAMVLAYVEAASCDPQSYRLMVDLNQGDTDNRELIDAKNYAMGACRGVVRQAIERAELAADTDPNRATHVLWSGAHGVVSLSLAKQLVLGCSFEELVPLVADTLVSGLQNPDPITTTE